MDLVINVSADPGAVTRINSDGQTATNRLIYALVVATSIPAMFFLLFGWAVSTHKAASDGYALLVFLAIAHVPLTAFFWVDRRYREHMASDVGTYYGVPALIIGTATAVPLIFGAVGLTYLFIGYFVWLLWHYGRQNLGVLSLVSIGTKTPAPSKIERHLYDAACIAGLMGALATLPQAKESVLAPVLNISYWVGLGRWWRSWPHAL